MKLRTLVFSGCGTRIIGHTGFLCCIEKHFDLSLVDTYAGTSAGSFIALCMALGYKPKELFDLLLELDYIKVSNIDADLLLDYYSKFGVDNGEKVMKLVKLVISKKTNNSDITFKELHELTGKTLLVATTNVNKECVEYITHETFPDLPVYLGIKMSGSIPYYFTPVKWNGCLYVDGALIDNFPIKNFNLDETIGMYIKKQDPYPTDITDLLNYTISILGTLLKVSENDLLSKYANNAVVIENEESILDFKLSKEKRQKIFSMAYSATEEFILKLLEKERLRKQIEEKENKDTDEYSNEERVKEKEESNTQPRRESIGSADEYGDGSGDIATDPIDTTSTTSITTASTASKDADPGNSGNAATEGIIEDTGE